MVPSFAMADTTPATTARNGVWDERRGGVRSAVELRVVTIVGGDELGAELASQTQASSSGACATLGWVPEPIPIDVDERP
jgi:hypothetical protein